MEAVQAKIEVLFSDELFARAEDVMQASNRSPDRKLIGQFLREGGKCAMASPGHDKDVITRELIPGTPEIRKCPCFTWDNTLAHYVEVYGVGLPENFEAYMLAAV